MDPLRALLGLVFLVLFGAGVFALMRWNARACMEKARRAAVEAGLTLVEGTWKAHLESYEGHATQGGWVLRYAVRVGKVSVARLQIAFPRPLTFSPLLRSGPIEWAGLLVPKLVGGVWFGAGRAHPAEAWPMIPPEIHARLAAHEAWRSSTIALKADRLEVTAPANAIERPADTRELTETLVLVAQHLLATSSAP